MKPRHQKPTWNPKLYRKTLISITLQGLSWLKKKNLMAALRLELESSDICIIIIRSIWASVYAHWVVDICLLSTYILVGNRQIPSSNYDKSVKDRPVVLRGL